MFRDLLNTTNTTLLNVTVSAPVETAEYATHAAFAAGTAEFHPPAPPVVDRPRDPALVDENGLRILPPLLLRDNALRPTYEIAGLTVGTSGENCSARSNCHAPLNGRHLAWVQVRFLFQSPEARERTTQLLYGVTADRLFLRFGALRPCFTERFENVRLECDPAPSPPPPNTWTIPPSPPALAFELVTLSAGTGGSFFVVLFGCLCCAWGARTRHTSRMLGTREMRVDEQPYGRQEHKRRGEAMRGPFAGSGTAESTALSFSGWSRVPSKLH